MVGAEMMASVCCEGVDADALVLGSFIIVKLSRWKFFVSSVWFRSPVTTQSSYNPNRNHPHYSRNPTGIGTNMTFEYF